MFTGLSFDSVWSALLVELLHTGEESKPRGFPIYEKLNVQVRVEKMLNNILISPERKPNYKFMVAEWLWIWFGMDDVRTISQYNKEIAKFSDDGEILSGAYGPRLIVQEAHVAKTLAEDRDSRQAVFTIFSPHPPKSKDIPCTLTLQIFVRAGVVHATVNMRSSDIWLGLPYDFFTFSMFVNLFCSKFMPECELGSMTFNLGSSHLYHSDLHKAEHVNLTGVNHMSSPRLPVFPSNTMKMVLRDPKHAIATYVEPPWSLYSEILGSPKENALSILAKLEP